MNEASRKRLMRYLRRCACYPPEKEGEFPHYCDYCPGCLTFKDPADRDAVFEKLVESENDYNEFWNFAYDKWLESLNTGEFYFQTRDRFKWLFSRTPEGDYRLCVLVGEYLKTKGE